MDEDDKINQEVDTYRENKIDWDKVEHDCKASAEDGCENCGWCKAGLAKKE